MPANDPPLSFPVRGVPRSWRDWWDDPDDHPALRAMGEATERRQTMRAEFLGIVKQGKLRAGLAGTLRAPPNRPALHDRTLSQ